MRDQQGERAPKAFLELLDHIVEIAHQDPLAPIEKLSGYLYMLQNHTGVAHVSLAILSAGQWLQTVLKHAGSRYAYTLSTASQTAEYGYAHQIGEMIREEPFGSWVPFSNAAEMPRDLKDLAAAENLQQFQILGVCNSVGVLKACLVTGHKNGEVFDTRNWQALAQPFQLLLYSSLRESLLERYITFAEMVKSAHSKADMVAVVTRWLPHIIFGRTGRQVQCSIGVLTEDREHVDLYKSVVAAGGEEVRGLQAKQEAVNRSRSNTVQRHQSYSSGSRPGRTSDTTTSDTSGDRGSKGSNTSSTSAAYRVILGKGPDDITAFGTLCQTTRLPMANTHAMEVVNQVLALHISNMWQHLNDHPLHHHELLFNSTNGAPLKCLLLPVCMAGRAAGVLYLSTETLFDLCHAQWDAETLLVIVGELMLATLGPNAEPCNLAEPPAAPMSYPARKARQLVTKSIGHKSKLEVAPASSTVSALKSMFEVVMLQNCRGMELPEICQPEDITLEGLAGTGSFGIVYKGCIATLNLQVAVKVMPLSPETDELVLVRNASEMATMNRIRHPNIVTIIAQFPDCLLVEGAGMPQLQLRRRWPGSQEVVDGCALRRCHVVVMEYCAFGTLRNALQVQAFKNRQGSTDMNKVCSVLLEVAAALRHVHTYGIIHCDVKPQNIMLKSEDTNARGFVTKLADFGLARLVLREAPIVAGDSAGTPSHLAPEIVRMGDRMPLKTAKADVYALGVLMWEMYMSKAAFAAVDKQAVLAHVVVSGHRLPFPPGTPPAFVALCNRCWHEDMDERPTMEEVQDALTALMAVDSAPDTEALAARLHTAHVDGPVEHYPESSAGQEAPAGAQSREAAWSAQTLASMFTYQ